MVAWWITAISLAVIVVSFIGAIWLTAKQQEEERMARAIEEIEEEDE